MESKVEKFEKICKGRLLRARPLTAPSAPDGNVGIKFSEMTADDVMRKLEVIEKDARRVWDAITTHYGDGFFTDIIEQEYGLNPNSHQEILDQMAAFLKEHQEASEAKFTELSRESLRLVLNMRDEVKEKDEEVARLRSFHLTELEALKAELAQDYEDQLAE